jgi:hypothetical protein
MGPAEAPAGAGGSAGDIGQEGGVGLMVLYQGRVKLFLDFLCCCLFQFIERVYVSTLIMRNNI